MRVVRAAAGLRFVTLRALGCAHCKRFQCVGRPAAASAMSMAVIAAAVAGPRLCGGRGAISWHQCDILRTYTDSAASSTKKAATAS